MLIGKDLRLRPIAPDDAQLLADWYSDPAYLGTYFNIWPSTRQGWERAATRESGKDEGIYLMASCEMGEPMGTIGYFNPFTMSDWFKGLELWWQVHPRFRQRGIATQAVCVMINHLFDATPIERLHATVVVGNDLSCRVAEGAGMQRDGLYRKVCFLHGQYVDMHLFAIVRDVWKDEATYRQGRRPF